MPGWDRRTDTDRRGRNRRGGAGADDTSPAATPASTRQHLAALGSAHLAALCRPAGLGGMSASLLARGQP
ncbi:hypothetical protein STEG23_002688 [Scotinomys teguina]